MKYFEGRIVLAVVRKLVAKLRKRMQNQAKSKVFVRQPCKAAMLRK